MMWSIQSPNILLMMRVTKIILAALSLVCWFVTVFLSVHYMY